MVTQLARHRHGTGGHSCDGHGLLLLSDSFPNLSFFLMLLYAFTTLFCIFHMWSCYRSSQIIFDSGPFFINLSPSACFFLTSISPTEPSLGLFCSSILIFLRSTAICILLCLQQLFASPTGSFRLQLMVSIWKKWHQLRQDRLQAYIHMLKKLAHRFPWEAHLRGKKECRRIHLFFKGQY